MCRLSTCIRALVCLNTSLRIALDALLPHEACGLLKEPPDCSEHVSTFEARTKGTFSCAERGCCNPRAQSLKSAQHGLCLKHVDLIG